MIATIPGATNLCICGHNGTAHDATSQVCRFQKDAAAPCGCVSFGRPGTLSGSAPASTAVASALTGPNVVAPLLAGNRNF